MNGVSVSLNDARNHMSPQQEMIRKMQS